MLFIEALACSSTVLTCPRGSVPELLRDGVTGYARCEDEERVQAARRVHLIYREGCRAYARRRFDIHRLALEYVNIYCRVRQRKTFFSLPMIEAETGIVDEAAAGATPLADVVTWIAPTPLAAEIILNPITSEPTTHRAGDRAPAGA